MFLASGGSTGPTITDWIVAGAGAAQVVTAVAIVVLTVLLVKYNRRLAREAKESREVAEKSAEAAIKSATAATDAVKHMRREQEIAVRPRLVLRGVPQRSWDPKALPQQGNVVVPPVPAADQPEVALMVTVVNLGHGLAVDVGVANQGLPWLRYADQTASIPPGGEARFWLTVHNERPDHMTTPPQGLFTLPDHDHGSGARAFNSGRGLTVLLCRDETGERVYRFASDVPGYEVWDAEHAPEWSADVKYVAPWLTVDGSNG
jgi:hypothetical protein